MTLPDTAGHRAITKDPVYDTVEATDFAAMIAPDRYLERTGAFDRIVAATHSHFWDPLDPRYIDFSTPFDLDNEYIIDPAVNVELKTAVADRLDERQKIKLVNDSTLWACSSILHGEQAALSLSASLIHILRDPGAQEYAANQAREEARHVTAFARYIQARWKRPRPCGPTLASLLGDLVRSPHVWQKLVGMQLLVEGLAMGAFATFYDKGRDPLLRHLCQLVMTDEAFHHRFGKIWAKRTMPHVTREEHDTIEDWALGVFNILLFNLTSPEQKTWIYAPLGLDWKWVQAAFMEALTDEAIRERLSEASNIFRVLIKTLLNTGIITDRTAGSYAFYVDLGGLAAEGDRMIGDEIADGGMAYLRQLNGAA